MSKNPIEAQWLDVEKEYNGFCCDEHREIYRGMFFAGAMAAMQAITGWCPERPRVFVLNSREMVAVADELTAEFRTEEAAANQIHATPELVRH